jgi:thiol-disulfide isomerase/thioredoxin
MTGPKTSRQQTPSRNSAKPGPAPTTVAVWITIAVVVVVALAAIIATAARHDDSSSATTTPAGVEQVRPVEITGTPLVEMPSTGTDPAIGTKAPVIAGQSFDGTALTTQNSAPTLLIFLAHWCPHCQREVPRLVQWHADGQVPPGLNVIGIATSTSSDLPNYPPSAWLEREKFPWPVIADSANSDAATAMGLPAFPYFLLLDADGNVLVRQTGEIEPSDLTALINNALA